jgi:hypothetical protein
VKHKAINGLGDTSTGSVRGLGAVSAALVTAALTFITTILSFFKGKKNPATGEEYGDENITEAQVRDMLNQAEQYDEEGNPINTTAQPQAEQNFWQRAGNFVNKASNIVSTYLPSGGGGSSASQPDDDYEYEPVNQDDMIISPASGNSSAVTANVMTGGMISNIGNFVKKNAVMLGVAALGIGGVIYFMTRKKKGKGLSGVRAGAHSRSRSKRPNRPQSLKSIKLS